MTKKLVLKKLEDYDTKPVTTEKALIKKRFHEDGLYSEKIFGPIKDYTCMCGTYQPIGGTCENCGMAYEKSEVRSKRFGHIPLLRKVINPLFVWFLSSRTKCTTKIDLMRLIYYKDYLVFRDGEPEVNTTEDFDEEFIEEAYYVGADAVLKLLEWFDTQFKADEKFRVGRYIKPSEYKQLMAYRDDLVIDRVLVVPPDLRPILFTSNKMMIQENLSRLYSKLLNKLEHMSSKTKFIKDVGLFTFKNYAEMQYMCVTIYEEILNVFGGKKGLIRGNMLGKRIDASGRAVIAVDPSLKWNECKIPYHILLEIYKYVIAREIAKSRNILIFDVLNEIEESLKMKDYRFLKEVEQYVKGKYVILNRQPTLHKYGLLGFKTKVSTDATIKIHPLITTVYGADFDGDSCSGSVDLFLDKYDESVFKSNKSKKINVHMSKILDLEVS